MKGLIDKKEQNILLKIKMIAALIEESENLNIETDNENLTIACNELKVQLDKARKANYFINY